MSDLPEPVRRYFHRFLPAGQPPVRQMRMVQRGVLRADPRSTRWAKFSAAHIVSPASRRFSWDAKVPILSFLYLTVRDRYADGVGSSEIRFLSGFTIASEHDRPELNAASLHRYLAEAVWYPTALLPAAGVAWQPIDDRRALATLADGNNSVSLEFRFNDLSEAVAVYTSGRWRRQGKGFALTPWEGHFSEYRRHQGVLVPSHGEVGWHLNGQWEIVWKGEVTTPEYQFDQISG